MASLFPIHECRNLPEKIDSLSSNISSLLCNEYGSPSTVLLRIASILTLTFDNFFPSPRRRRDEVVPPQDYSLRLNFKISIFLFF